ncbi:MAG: pitrilysin family protein [Candidatus Pacebacteria bacterium]|jgi:predicted Zn-dependent peptidase|nr:pitrilysin family protein [Candidatus Paceibacterota bacterium]|tara:strand:+ start:47892 stop:49163 length:1272 start_codon:yes stop_codon:yes gene_type:complete
MKKIKTLSNGLKIVMVSMPKSLTTTVLVLTKTGSKYETKNINGISHFLEHLMFKGTEKRSSSREISEELDGLGAQYNAFTGYEYTGYYAQTEARHFKSALEVLSDIYLNATLPTEEIEKERGVIIGEIEMYEDNPKREVWDVFTDLLYGNQPAGWPIIGNRKNIREIKRKDLINYRKKNYVASSTVVVVAGKVDEKKVISEIKKVFSDISTSKKHGKKKTKDLQKKNNILIKTKKTSQTHLILGFRAYHANHKDNAAATVLAGVLGAGMSSRLFHRIRDQLGAGYYIKSDLDVFTDHGYLAIYTGVDNRRVPEILHAILDEVRLVKSVFVSEKELKKVKNYLIGNLFSSLETSHARAQFYGLEEALGKKLKTPQEYAHEIQKVSARDIKRVAGDIFKTRKSNLALIGPFTKKREKGLEKLLVV